MCVYPRSREPPNLLHGTMFNWSKRLVGNRDHRSASSSVHMRKYENENGVIGFGAFRIMEGPLSLLIHCNLYHVTDNPKKKKIL